MTYSLFPSYCSPPLFLPLCLGQFLILKYFLSLTSDSFQFLTSLF